MKKKRDKNKSKKITSKGIVILSKSILSIGDLYNNQIRYL